MLQASYTKHNLKFKIPATTSRGVLNTKDSYIIKIWHKENKSIFGLGECSPILGLSIDNLDNFEEKVSETCQMISKLGDIPAELELEKYPAIEFGLETALLDLENGGVRKIVDTDFYNNQAPIPINGLVWMSDKDNMKSQIKDKLDQGFECIKLKIGAINFDDECHLLEEIRKNFSADDIEIRVDANGAFSPETALDKLNKLSKFDLHSIEQPIKQGQWAAMSKLCKDSPLPIALDEELIGINSLSGKKMMLQIIKPDYIILKPTLLGGFQSSQDWIEIAHESNIDWWITSALESNIGLNAISQWTSSFNLDTFQGLGTGSLYENNYPSPLKMEKGNIFYDQSIKWDLSSLGDF